MKSIQDQYFDLLTSLKNKKEKISDTETLNIDEIAEKANTLLPDISNSTELLLDAKISSEVVNISALNFDKNLRNKQATVPSFINRLNKALVDDGSKTTNIHKIKMERFFKNLKSQCYGVSFKKQYSMDIIEQELRIKSIDNEKQDVKKTEIKHEKMKKNDNFMEKIERICDVLGNKRLEYYELVIDPGSYSKTIENIFYLSFAIKLELVQFHYENGTIFVLRTNKKVKDLNNSTKRKISNGDIAVKEIDSKNTKEKHTNHFINTIDYMEYKRIIKKLRIKKAFI